MLERLSTWLSVDVVPSISETYPVTPAASATLSTTPACSPRKWKATQPRLRALCDQAVSIALVSCQ
jgi:hypothetical protein